MSLNELIGNDQMEMLKWVSERNLHVPLSELAFMLDMDDDMPFDNEADDYDSVFSK